MCASPREPEHEAPEAAQRALEEEEEARIASASLAAGDPTGWFDRLYATGARGQVPVPWRRRQPHPLLARWATEQELSGAAQRAVVVGCALGADAEYVASLGFVTTGFDISGNPGITATLYNTGDVIERAQTLAAENKKRRAQGWGPSFPRENYYGWLINDRLDELRKLVPAS